MQCAHLGFCTMPPQTPWKVQDTEMHEHIPLVSPVRARSSPLVVT
jgi:hypothetical protein